MPTILVVDDDDVTRALLRLHLVSAGYGVLEAEDGIAGGYAAWNDKPDIIIADVDMPHMNGYELVEALKADRVTTHIPVVFVTSRDDVHERCAQLQAKGYLKKPVKAGRLLELLELILGPATSTAPEDPHRS